MLDLLRRDPEKIRWSQRRRGVDFDIIEKALHYDEEWRTALMKLDQLRSERNKISDTL